MTCVAVLVAAWSLSSSCFKSYAYAQSCAGYLYESRPVSMGSVAAVMNNCVNGFGIYGTAGLKVKKWADDGTRFMLDDGHVINAFGIPNGITQPWNCTGDYKDFGIGTLAGVMPLEPYPGYNLADAAVMIGEVGGSGTLLDPEIFDLGVPSQKVAQPSLYLPVAFYGQADCLDRCTIVATGRGATININGVNFNFIEQIYLTCQGSSFSGDSGAAIITATDNCHEPVGMWEAHFNPPFPSGFQQYPNLGIAWVTSAAFDYFQMSPSGTNTCQAGGVTQAVMAGAPAVSNPTIGEPSPNIPPNERGVPGIASYPFVPDPLQAQLDAAGKMVSSPPFLQVLDMLRGEGVPVVEWGPSDRKGYVQIDINVRAPLTEAMKAKIAPTIGGYPVEVEETTATAVFDTGGAAAGSGAPTH